MTIDELIEEAAKLKGWVFDEDGDIRLMPSGGYVCCPITAVAYAYGVYYPQDEWEEAAQYLRLAPRSAQIIVRAADSGSHMAKATATYLKMLKALNLDGKAAAVNLEKQGERK